MKSISLYFSLLFLLAQIACKPAVAPQQPGYNEDRRVAIHKSIEKYLIYNKIDPNDKTDGLIDKSLIQNVDTLRISLDSASYASLTGLKHFSGLKYLSLVSSVYFVSYSGNMANPNSKIPLDGSLIFERYPIMKCKVRSGDFLVFLLDLYLIPNHILVQMSISVVDNNCFKAYKPLRKSGSIFKFFPKTGMNCICFVHHFLKVNQA